MSAITSQNITTDKQRETITGVIMGLVKELEKLAPHPDRPQDKSPQFLQKSAYHQTASRHNSMLGSLMMESLLGEVFAEAANDTLGGWTQSIDWSKAADAASEYHEDRHVELGQRRVIANDFNRIGAQDIVYEQMLNAWLADLPRRLSIERYIAELSRKLYAIRKHSPSLAA